MPNLCIYLPSHGYSFNDEIFVSWLGDTYCAVNIDDGGDGLVSSSMGTNSFYLSTKSETNNNATTDIVQYSTTITNGYVRETDSSSATTTISGLDHLNGESVKLVHNGILVGSYVVSNGSITVPSGIYSSYSVGIPYSMKIRTTRLEVPNAATIQSRIKNINDVVVRHIRSKNGKAGQESGGYEYLNNLECDFSTDSADRTIATRGGFSDEGYVTIKSEDPYPFTVLATIISFTVDEKR